MGIGFFVFMGLLFYNTVIMTVVASYSEPTRLPVRLGSAENLKRMAPVFIYGVESGYVSSLHYVPLDERGEPIPYERLEHESPDSQAIVAILTLDKKVKFYPNYRVYTKYQSVLSQKAVDLYPGKAESPWHEKNDPWYEMTMTLGEIVNFRTTGILPTMEPHEHMLKAINYDDPLYLVATVIFENRTSLRNIIHGIREVTDKIDQGGGNISLIVNKAQLVDSVNQTLVEADQLVNEVGEGLETLRENDTFVDMLAAWFSIVIGVFL